LGALYDTLGRYEDAADAYRRAMALSPYHSAWIASNLGLTYCMMGRLAASERMFRQVVKHHPDYFRAYIGLVVVEKRLGRNEEARRAAALLRRLDPLFRADDWGAHSFIQIRPLWMRLSPISRRREFGETPWSTAPHFPGRLLTYSFTTCQTPFLPSPFTSPGFLS